MSSVLAPSFLLELGAYAIAAAGIRLFRNRSSRTRQQEAQEHPDQHTSPRVIGLSQASPLLSTCRSSSRSPQPCPDYEARSPQAAGISSKDEAKGQSAVAQASDVVMPEADAVLFQPQTTTAATETAATPSVVPSRSIALPDPAFVGLQQLAEGQVAEGQHMCVHSSGHVTALPVTCLPESLGNRNDNIATDNISSHSHNSNLVHGDASRALDVTGNMSDGGSSAGNNDGVPNSKTACHNKAAGKAPAAAAGGEQQDVSSGPDRAHAIWPESVKVAHRDVDISSAGDCDQSTGPTHLSVSEDDSDVDIMTREDPPGCDHMAVGDPSDGGNDVISASGINKHEEEVVGGMDWAWGAATFDDHCDNVDQDRSILLSAIQKHKRSAEHDLDNTEMRLFVSKKRTCGPLIGEAEEEEKGSTEPATAEAAVPGDDTPGEAQPNDLLQEIASVTLRLLAGALQCSLASEAAQPDPSPLSQVSADQQEQSPHLDINPAPSQTGQTLAEPGIEEEEGQRVGGSQSQSAGICLDAMPMLDEESEEAQQHTQTSSGQPSHFGSALPDSLTEAEVCSQAAFGQPDQAVELERTAEKEDQDSGPADDQTHDSHSDDAEAIEHSQVAEAIRQGAALNGVRMASEWTRWLYKACGAAPSLPAAHSRHQPQHDAMTCPDSSPDAEATRARSLQAEADMAAGVIQHGQFSLPASDSAANPPPASLPSESPASHTLAGGEAALAAALSLPGDSSSAAAISAPEASGAPAADTPSPANVVETTFAAPSGHCEGYEQVGLEGSDELRQAVNLPAVHSAVRAEPTEESGDEAHASKADKYQPGERHHRAECGSGWGIATQLTLGLPRPSHYAGSCFSKSVEAQAKTTRGGSYQPNFCHESDYLFHDSTDQLQPQSTLQLEQLPSSGLLKQLPDRLNEVCTPDVHQPHHGQLEEASPAVSDDYESQAFHAEHPGAAAQTDWGCELPTVDSAPPIISKSPPEYPTSGSALGSPDRPAVDSPAVTLAQFCDPEYASASGAGFTLRYRAMPASPAAQSPAWGSTMRACYSSPLRHISPSKSPAWQTPGRAARDSLDCHSPGSPGSPAAPPATLPHGNVHIHIDQSKPTRWSRSPEHVPFWNLPKLISASAARAADDSPGHSQPLKEAEDRLSEPAMSPRYLPSGGGMEEEDRQMYAEPDHEEEDNGMAEIKQGQQEEGDEADASKYEGAYARPRVSKTARDYVHDAWDLSESSEEDAEDNAPARADVEREEEDVEFQVRGSMHPDSAEEEEGMHGTRAAAGSSPGQALSPGPDKMWSQDEEEDCMLEEEDCKEKHLAAALESEGLSVEEDVSIDSDDEVQFMGETGPDPSKSAFQLARKRLASIRASQRSGEEEDDVELYPGVQDLISGTLQSGCSTDHHVGDFAAELSKGSSILRHFKRLRKLPSAARTSELSQRSAFWSRQSSVDLQAGLRAAEADQPHPQAHASAQTDHCSKGPKHRRHAHHNHRHHHHHHERRGRRGWKVEAIAVAGRDLDSSLNANLNGGLGDSKEDQADRSSGQE